MIAIYSAGVFIGAGIGLFLGGSTLDAWNAAYPDTSLAPFGLRGWQVAFMAIGLPGILVAIWVRTLKEPTRGQSEGVVTEPHHAPFPLLGSELAAVIPPFNLISLMGEPRALVINAIAAAAIVAAAAGLIALTGSWEQWIAFGIGIYISFTWAQSLRIRDPATFGMILRSKAIIYTFIAFAPGPYVIGQLSDVFNRRGMESGEALQHAMALSMLIFSVTLICIWLAQRHLPTEEANRLERARALGEPV